MHSIFARERVATRSRSFPLSSPGVLNPYDAYAYDAPLPDA